MKGLLIIPILFCLTSGCQTLNSNSEDDKLFVDAQIDTSTPAGQRFAAAYAVLKDKCMTCHTSNRHDHWAAYTEENDWYVREGDDVLVVSNNPAASAVIYRLKTWGSEGGMPEGPDTLTEEEYIILRDWIQNIGM